MQRCNDDAAVRANDIGGGMGLPFARFEHIQLQLLNFLALRTVDVWEPVNFVHQNVPSSILNAGGEFGFLTLIQCLARPEPWAKPRRLLTTAFEVTIGEAKT